jgi:hypothetical protein
MKTRTIRQRGGISRGEYYGGINSFSRGRGRHREGELKCYACERQGIYLGNVLRKRKMEVEKLTFPKHRRGMWRNK